MQPALRVAALRLHGRAGLVTLLQTCHNDLPSLSQLMPVSQHAVARGLTNQAAASGHHSQGRNGKEWNLLAGGSIAAFTLLAGWQWGMTNPALADASKPAPAKQDKPKELPLYTKEDVAKHKTKEQRIWVTYKEGVYDITDFIAMHPGGAHKIMMAAGASVEPFWAMYQQHMKPEVGDIIKEYRIGTLKDYKPDADKADRKGAANPWVNEPERHPALIRRSENPCNAETPGHILAGGLITPTDLFYVRNHLPVPDIDASKYRLVVEGEGLRRLELSLDNLQRHFKKHTITATVQCTGNRRNEMKAVKPVKGLDWDIGAIGTAQWAGVRLLDVLEAAGIDPDDPDAPLHIQFEGADTDPVSGEVYGASIPAHIALGAHRDVLLAYEMNGQPLTRDHGAPVRVVVPGVVGARSVKWLTKVKASKEESMSHWQQRDYKSFSPSTDWDTVDWDSAPAIIDAPVTSAITEPLPDTVLPKETSSVTVRGYAWSGAGADIIRVDVTGDDGKSWHTAELKKLPQKPGKAWAWTQWEVDVPLPKNHSGPVQLAVKATDMSYNTQPDSVQGVWNLRGVVNNAWHRINLKVA